MAKARASTKRNLITQANKTIVVATAIAAFVVVFSLVAGKALLSQAGYQNRVIDGKKEALAQLQANLNARDSLVNSYEAFVESDPNLIAGNPNGTGPQDGDNAKIILDALPSKYDFPALTTSLEKLISDQQLQIINISGTDDEVAQAAADGSSQPVPIPFQVQVSGSYQSIQSLIGVFERSIRPFQVQTIELTGGDSNMIAVISAQTFYQPGKGLTITTKVVK